MRKLKDYVEELAEFILYGDVEGSMATVASKTNKFVHSTTATELE